MDKDAELGIPRTISALCRRLAIPKSVQTALQACPIAWGLVYVNVREL